MSLANRKFSAKKEYQFTSREEKNLQLFWPSPLKNGHNMKINEIQQ